MTSDDMDAITRDLPTTAAKIRELARRGVPRADIARYLSIRYQHVRNVLVAPAPSGGPPAAAAGRASRGGSKPPPAVPPDAPLSIEQAKRGLAAHFGVSPDAIEITIRG